jgi:heavy metal sensor kinase
MKRRRASVRARLTFWHAGVLTVIICAFATGIFLFVRARLYHDLDQQISRDLVAVERVYRQEPWDLGELDDRVGITLFQVVEGGQVRFRTDKWQSVNFASPTPSDRHVRLAFSTAAGTTPYRIGTMSEASYVITVAREEGAVRHALWILVVILSIGAPCAVGLAIAGGYFLAGRVLSPVGAMAEQARKVSADSLGERLTVENPKDEFGQLALVFNDTFSRLHDAFEQLRRFTADASHELRTPLTAIRSVGEVALQRSLDPEAYREVIGSMLEEVDRLTRLVESLLTLTRGESGRIRPALEVVNVGRLAMGVVEHLRVLAEEKEQGLTVDPIAEISAVCDPTILRQGLINVLDNAIKYTPRKGMIRVGVLTTPSGEASIEVQDTGQGIPEVHRERIFERFYRVDEGRSADSGGVGLGLAIARWAVEANGGHIDVDGEEGKGTLFRIVLPKLPR